MTNTLQELNRVLEEMPGEMVREVLNFALFLQRKQAESEGQSDEDADSRYGLDGDGFNLLDRWDAVESPMNRRDIA